MEHDATSLQAAIAQAIRGILKDLPIGYSATESIYRQMAQEIIAVARHDEDGQAYAPDQYTLSVHPSSSEELGPKRVEVQTSMADELKRVLNENRFILVRQPHITFASDPTLPENEIRVIAWHSSDPLGLTDSGDYIKTEESQPEIPSGAFLVVEGKRHFKLEQPVIRIGRRPDNDLVLENKHISRSHAMLQAVEGRYILRDLGSTAGTRLNHHLIKEAAVKPGDIITLATIELIYGEDRTGPPDETPPYTPEAPDRDQIYLDTPLDLKVYREETTTGMDRDAKDN